MIAWHGPQGKAPPEAPGRPRLHSMLDDRNWGPRGIGCADSCCVRRGRAPCETSLTCRARQPQVPQCREGGEDRSVGEVAAMVHDGDVATDRPHAFVWHHAERLDVDSLALADGPLQQPRQLHGRLARPPWFKDGRGHR